MPNKITDIEGIGPSFAEKLSAASIETTDELLDQCATPQGRKSGAEKTGVGEGTILKWTNMADMMRVSGIGGQFAELLNASGVDTVKELRTRNPENLATKMNEVNTEKKLTKGTFSTMTVTDWIEKASELDPKITY